MGTRFYRRIKILPGVTINLSKSGASVSLGRRGARVTLGKKGVRETVGIPGTGLSYTNYTKHRKSRPNVDADNPETIPLAQPNFYLDRLAGVFFKRGVTALPAKFLVAGILWLLFFVPLATAAQPQPVVWGMVSIGLVLVTIMLLLGLLSPRLVFQPDRGAVASVFGFYVIALIVVPMLGMFIVSYFK